MSALPPKAGIDRRLPHVRFVPLATKALQCNECREVPKADIQTSSSRQLGPIETEFLADTAQFARIEVLARTTKWRLRCPPFSMYRHHDMTLAALMMLMTVEATPLRCQPFPKCCAFHYPTPVPEVN
jgi:hypothetical protein